MEMFVATRAPAESGRPQGATKAFRHRRAGKRPQSGHSYRRPVAAPGASACGAARLKLGLDASDWSSRCFRVACDGLRSRREPERHPCRELQI